MYRIKSFILGRIPRRVRVAMAVLRGQSVMYRMTVEGGVILTRPRSHTHVVECLISGGAR